MIANKVFVFLMLMYGYVDSQDLFTNQGVWLSSDYIKYVKEFKSLKSSIEMISMSEFPVYIITNPNENEIEANFNFHESGEIQYKEFKNGKFNLISSLDYDSLKFKDDTIRIFKNDEYHKYFKVAENDSGLFSKLTVLISNNIFDRKYSCSNHKIIAFNGDSLVLDGYAKKFVFEFDYVEYAPLDLIYVSERGGNRSVLGLAGTNSFLSLYNMKYENHVIGNVKYLCGLD